MKKPKTKIKQTLREFILDRDDYRCRYCGSTKTPFHLDHVYPESRGGETSDRNLVTSCEKCNRKKHDFVGDMYPKPIGYFKAKSNWRTYFWSMIFIGLGIAFGVTGLFLISVGDIGLWFISLSITFGFPGWVVMMETHPDKVKMIYE